MSNTTGTPLTADEVKRIRQSLTWGDHFYGRKAAKEDGSDEATPYTLYRAAKRLGIAAPDELMDDFLDRTTMDVLGDGLAAGDKAEGDEDPTSDGRS